MAAIDPTRLYTALLNTGLQSKDNPLYQVIHELIRTLAIVNIQANASTASASSSPVLLQGPIGISGLDGLDGDDGAIGLTGQPGSQGLQGVSGIDGLDGLDGLDSFIPGPQGIPGPTGLTIFVEDGLSGEDGPPGLSGKDGAQGAQGIQGIQGIPGPTGPQGITGLDGDYIEDSLIHPNMSAFDLSNGVTGSGAVVLATSPALLTSPTAPTQATTDNSTKLATTAYVTTAITNAIAGVNPAVAVQAATAAVLPNTPTYNNGVAGIGATLTAGVTNTALVVDGYTPILNERILVKNQASAFQNGVYFLSTVSALGIAWILTRALDYNAPSDINNTGAIPVTNGTVNIDTTWVLTSTVNTVGTDALTYVQFSLNPNVALPVNKGGTGVATLGANGVLIGEGTGNVAVTGVGTAGQVLTSNGAGVDPTFQASAGATFANPTGTIGLTAVNGVLTTATRSDGTHALSQAIVPTWTQLHTFSAGFTSNANSLINGTGSAGNILDLKTTGVNSPGLQLSNITTGVLAQIVGLNTLGIYIAVNAGNTFAFESNSLGNWRGRAYGAGTATFDANGNITSVSDERIKDIQGSFITGLSAILALEPIQFHYNALSGLDPINLYAGFSAQNVLKFIPQAVGKNSDGIYGLNPTVILAAVVNAIKSMSQEIDILRAELKLPMITRIMTPQTGENGVIISPPKTRPETSLKG